MPRKKKGNPPAKKGGGTGIMALATAAAAKAGNLPDKEWRPSLNPNALGESLPHLPTGSLIIDFLIGGELNGEGVRPCPGLPRGRVAQIWGHNTGPLVNTAIETTLEGGGVVLYIDWNNTLPQVPSMGFPEDVRVRHFWASVQKVKSMQQKAWVEIPQHHHNLVMVKTTTLEVGIQLAMLAAAARFDLVVFGGVGAPVSRRVAIGEVHPDLSRSESESVWSHELPNLQRIVSRNGGALLGVSNLRTTTSPSGHQRTLPEGGNAWKFYTSVRLEIRRIQSPSTYFCKVVKSKVSASQGRGSLFYIQKDVVDDVQSLMTLGVTHGFINQVGERLSCELPSGHFGCQNPQEFREHLEESSCDLVALYGKATEVLGRPTPVGEVLDVEAILSLGDSPHPDGA